MPQVSTLGALGDYPTIAAWAAAEGSSDYGVGNPTILEFLELVNESAAVTGSFPRGYIMRAAAGLELNKETLVGVGNSGDTRPNISTSGAVAQHENIIINSSAFGSTTDALYEDCYLTSGLSITTKKVTTRRCIFVGMARALDASGGNAFAIAENCTAIDNTGTFAFVRWKFTNCLYIDNGGGAQGFAATVAGSDYNASNDTTAPGANSLQNRTTADLVNYAFGDYRTASSSALATAGTGGSFIGYALESGGGGTISVDGAISQFDFSSLSSSVELTGEISVNGQASTFDFSALNSIIDLTGEIEVAGNSANFDFLSISGVVDLAGQINITGNGASFDFISRPSIVDLTGNIQVDGQPANFNFFAIDSNVDLAGEILITGNDASFDFIGNDGTVNLTTDIQINGQSANFDFNGINADVVLAGEISIQGDTATFNYEAYSGNVKVGGGQKIGTVTTGFADNEISVKYKQRTITVRFGE